MLSQHQRFWHNLSLCFDHRILLVPSKKRGEKSTVKSEISRPRVNLLARAAGPASSLLIDCIALFCDGSQLIRGLMCWVCMCAGRGRRQEVRLERRASAGQQQVNNNTLGHKLRDDCMFTLLWLSWLKGVSVLYVAYCTANHSLYA